MTPWRLVDSNTADCRPATGPWQSGAPPLEPYMNPARPPARQSLFRHHKRVLPCCCGLAAKVAKEMGVSQDIVCLGSPANPLQPAPSERASIGLPQDSCFGSPRQSWGNSYAAWTEHGKRCQDRPTGGKFPHGLRETTKDL